MSKRLSKLSRSLVLGLSLAGFGASIASAQVLPLQPGNRDVMVRPLDNFRAGQPGAPGNVKLDDQAWVKALVEVTVGFPSLTGAGERIRLDRINLDRFGRDRLGLYDR